MPLAKMRVRRLLLITCALCFCAYVASYFALTLNGRFEPGVWGINGVKRYDWAPKGFVRGYRWNMRLIYFYAPLYVLDRHFWHEFGDAGRGKYPINIPPQDKANGRE